MAMTIVADQVLGEDGSENGRHTQAFKTELSWAGISMM